MFLFLKLTVKLINKFNNLDMVKENNIGMMALSMKGLYNLKLITYNKFFLETFLRLF